MKCPGERKGGLRRGRGSASSAAMGEAATGRKVALPLLCCRKVCSSHRPPADHSTLPPSPTPRLGIGQPPPTVQGQRKRNHQVATPYSGMDEPATPYLRRRCPWWPLRPAAPEPGSEDAPAARGRPGGPRVGKSEARPGTARLRSMRKGSAGDPLPREARAPAPPPAAANRAPRCRDPPRPPPALHRPPLGAAPDPARRGAPGGKLGAADETRSDAAAAAAVPRLDRRPRQVPHPLQARRSSPDPRRDLPPPFAPPAATSASSEISPAASCPPPPLCSGPPGDPGVPGTGGGVGTRCSDLEGHSGGPCQAPDWGPEVPEVRWPESSGKGPGEVPEGRSARS